MEISDHESNQQIIKDVSSNFISTFCGDMFSFALGLMLLHATGMSLSFGVSMIIMPLVTLIGLVPIGNLVDSYPHKRLLIISLGIRILALLTYAMTISLFHGQGKLLPTVLFLIVNYASVNLSNSGYTASIRELVNGNHIQKLNALTQSASSFALVFSPIVAASLYVLMGFTAFLVFQLSAHVISLLILLTMRFHYQPQHKVTEPQNEQSQLAKFKSGLSYLASQPFLKYLICVALFLNFVFAVINVGLPFIIVQHLHLGNLTLGILNSMDAVGMLAGNLIISFLPAIKHLAKILALTLLTMSVAFAGIGWLFMATSNRLTVQVIGSLMTLSMGGALSFMNTPFGIYMQKTVPTPLMGRVTSTEISLNMMSIPVGTLFYSAIFQIFPSGAVFILSGIGMLIFTLATMPKFIHIQMPVDISDPAAVNEKTSL